jgi:hypothetical protein
VFAPEHVLQASAPIETPQGFVVAATRDLRPGLTSVTDRAMAFLVAFRTHSDEEFAEWYATRKPALRAELRYVAPELQDSLPLWLMP